ILSTRAKSGVISTTSEDSPMPADAYVTLEFAADLDVVSAALAMPPMALVNYLRASARQGWHSSKTASCALRSCGSWLIGWHRRSHVIRTSPIKKSSARSRHMTPEVATPDTQPTKPSTPSATTKARKRQTPVVKFPARFHMAISIEMANSLRRLTGGNSL